MVIGIAGVLMLRLAAGQAWANAKGTVLTALSLPDSPDELLAGHATSLDQATADQVV